MFVIRGFESGVIFGGKASNDTCFRTQEHLVLCFHIGYTDLLAFSK
jgi:hypothetical protein